MEYVGGSGGDQAQPIPKGGSNEAGGGLEQTDTEGKDGRGEAGYVKMEPWGPACAADFLCRHSRLRAQIGSWRVRN